MEGENMRKAKTGLLKYFGSLSLVMATAVLAQTFSEWSVPVNLGSTNTAAAEQ
jgi:hypothetical protein